MWLEGQLLVQSVGGAFEGRNLNYFVRRMDSVNLMQFVF